MSETSSRGKVRRPKFLSTPHRDTCKVPCFCDWKWSESKKQLQDIGSPKPTFTKAARVPSKQSQYEVWFDCSAL